MKRKKLNHLICPACNTFNSKIYFKSVKKDLSLANFNYIKCSNCYTIYLSKKNFSDLKLERFHKLNWRKKNNFKFVKKPDPKKIINSWKHTCSKLKLDNNSSILDIGCGNGYMLIALKEIGFQSLYGFDSDTKLINKLKKKYDINFFYDNFDSFYKNKNISNLKFDYIFLNGVLEHSYDPSKLLEKTRKLATKKTKIFIKVPSGESLQMEFLKEFNWSSFAPYHRTLFSKKGLISILNKNLYHKINFLNEYSKVYGWTRGISWMLNFEKKYKNLRKDKSFSKFDFYVDDLFENIANKFNGPSNFFLKCSIK